MQRMRSLPVIALLLLGCNERVAFSQTSSAAAAVPSQVASSTAQPPSSAGPIRIEALPGAEPPVFVMQGGPRGPQRLVFLHGMCGHGLGYAQSFQFSAAKLGTLIAPQADVSCGGVWSKWSGKLDQLDERITNAFRALGHRDPIDDIIVIGMSQGATRAAALAQKWPQRYTRLISMDAPNAIGVGELRELRGAVMMAGERDRQDLMRASERALKRTGVPVTFVLIPGATHGAMGPTPEQTMSSALSFLEAPAASVHQTP
jgi:pimeloyl-ACP methyl ester carboxylesterase